MSVGGQASWGEETFDVWVWGGGRLLLSPQGHIKGPGMKIREEINSAKPRQPYSRESVMEQGHVRSQETKPTQTTTAETPGEENRGQECDRLVSTEGRGACP